MRLPHGVPGPTRVSISFFLGDSTAVPSIPRTKISAGAPGLHAPVCSRRAARINTFPGIEGCREFIESGTSIGEYHGHVSQDGNAQDHLYRVRRYRAYH